MNIDILKSLRDQIAEIEGRPIADSEFARRFLPFSAAAWSRLLAGSYPASDSIEAKINQAEEDIRSRLPAIREAAAASGSFRHTTIARAVLSALSRAQDGADHRRVVVLLAPSGFGKTAIRDYLASRGAVTVDGRQAWRHSYKSFCLDVATAAGRTLSPNAPEHRTEAEMLSALGRRNGVLYIDEANTMSRDACNGIKSIVNTTGFTVVLAAIPELWDRFLQTSYHEAAQLINRCQPIIRASRVSSADVSLFLSDKTRDIPDVADSLAEAATAFGGFRTPLAVLAALERMDSPGPEDLAAELRFIAQSLRASGLGSPVETSKKRTK